jgi:hypothetical protein
LKLHRGDALAALKKAFREHPGLGNHRISFYAGRTLPQLAAWRGRVRALQSPWSWNRPILTEIYLCHACSYHEIVRQLRALRWMVCEAGADADAEDELGFSPRARACWLPSAPPPALQYLGGGVAYLRVRVEITGSIMISTD